MHSIVKIYILLSLELNLLEWQRFKIQIGGKIRQQRTVKQKHEKCGTQVGSGEPHLHGEYQV